jgi:hypothetical protein
VHIFIARISFPAAILHEFCHNKSALIFKRKYISDNTHMVGDLMNVYRPRGIIVLAVLFMITAALGIIIFIYYETTWIPYYYQLMVYFTYMASLNLGSFFIYPISFFYGYYAYGLTMFIPQFQIEAVGAFIISETGIPTIIGLLMMKKWGYHSAVIIGILWIIVSIYPSLAILGIPTLIFGIAVIAYLFKSDAKNYFEPYRIRFSPRTGVRTSAEESEPKTGKTYRWQIEGAREEPEVSAPISKQLPKEKPRTSTAEKTTESGDFGEELEATSAKYEKKGIRVKTKEKTEKETPPKKQKTIPDKKMERLKDLESEEEATQVLLEELKGRWTSGKIDTDMYQKLKEKYEEKIEHIEKQKKKLKNKTTQL